VTKRVVAAVVGLENSTPTIALPGRLSLVKRACVIREIVSVAGDNSPVTFTKTHLYETQL